MGVPQRVERHLGQVQYPDQAGPLLGKRVRWNRFAVMPGEHIGVIGSSAHAERQALLLLGAPVALEFGNYRRRDRNSALAGLSFGFLPAQPGVGLFERLPDKDA